MDPLMVRSEEGTICATGGDCGSTRKVMVNDSWRTCRACCNAARLSARTPTPQVDHRPGRGARAGGGRARLAPATEEVRGLREGAPEPRGPGEHAHRHAGPRGIRAGR